jgi:hypothetical protein
MQGMPRNSIETMANQVLTNTIRMIDCLRVLMKMKEVDQYATLNVFERCRELMLMYVGMGTNIHWQYSLLQIVIWLKNSID